MMDPKIASSLIGFGGSTVSSLINYFGQQNQADRAFEHNKELARLSNQMNIDQWKRENEYNTPAAQMARYQAAGLNPNLIYGQQNLSANSPTLSGGSDYVSPNAQMLDPNALTNSLMLKAQVDNLNANTANTEESTSKIKTEVKKLEADIEKTNTENLAIQGQMTLEKQQALEVALRNWANGYRPREYVDKDGNRSYDAQDFGYEFYHQLNEVDSIISKFADERKVTSYNRQYLDKCFQFICEGDIAQAKIQIAKALGIDEFSKVISDDKLLSTIYGFIAMLTPSATSILRAIH